MTKMNKVLYNIDQTGDTSANEKRTARNNIGCPSIITSTNTLPPVETDINTLTFKTDSRVYADNTIIGNIAPNPGQNDAGKFLVAQWSGSPAIGTYGLAAVNQVPASTISNSGQALIVDASGNPVWSTFNALPSIGNNDNGKVLTVNGTSAEWQSLPTYGHQYAVYECVMTRTLDGTDSQIFVPKSLDMADYTMNEYFTNCTYATSIVHVHRDDRSFWTATFDGSYGSMYCYSVVAVGQGSNFATELACWGYDTTMCQIVAGMNRIWYLDHSGAVLCQNGVRDTTGTLKSGSISICFTFVWSV